MLVFWYTYIMSKVPLPERGQPLDVAYLYTLAEAINSLSEEGSALAQGNNFYFKGQGAPSLVSRKLYGAQVSAQYVEKEITNANEYIIPINFEPNFSSTPVVTATLVNPTSSSGINGIVTVRNLNTSRCDIGFVKTSTEGSGKVGFNIIAIGLPQNFRG